MEDLETEHPLHAEAMKGLWLEECKQNRSIADPQPDKTGITCEFEINGGSSWRVVDWDAYQGGRILAWFREQDHAEMLRDALMARRAPSVE